VKEIAARDGLHATFMGKPFNDQGGSGLHVHISLAGPEAGNALADPDGRDGIGADGWSFVAGVLDHAPALMAILAPTINAYRRIVPDSLAPTHASWGHDNRTTFVRIPVERGDATRLEVRAGDATANVHLVCAALLGAGLDGIERRLEPPPAVTGDAYAHDPSMPLPRTLDAALDALEGDAVLVERLGPELVEAFMTLKRAECERFGAWVSDWERQEYLPHL
jgi:glutamine synthetase